MLLMLLSMVAGPSDSELVRRFKGGDRRAYEEIVRRYQHKVFSVCLRWLRQPAIAEEVAQDVFIALFRRLADFRGDSQLSTWIFRVAVNHCKNNNMYRHRRAEHRHEPLEGPERDDGPRRQIAGNGVAADSQVFTSEAEKLVQDALEKLDEEQRTIIIMRDVEDLSYEEIADILEINRGTVKSRIHRARAALALILADKVNPQDIL